MKSYKRQIGIYEKSRPKPVIFMVDPDDFFFGTPSMM